METREVIEVDAQAGEVIEGEATPVETTELTVVTEPTNEIYSQRMVAIADREATAIEAVRQALALPNGVFDIQGKKHVGDVSLKAMAAWANVSIEYGEMYQPEEGAWAAKCTAIRQDGLRIEAHGACERTERYGKSLSSCWGMVQTRGRVRALSAMFSVLINIANGDISTTPAEEVWANEPDGNSRPQQQRQLPQQTQSGFTQRKQQQTGPRLIKRESFDNMAHAIENDPDGIDRAEAWFAQTGYSWGDYNYSSRHYYGQEK